MTEPNKETVRTPLPTEPDKAIPPGSTAKHAPRIVLPSRPSVAPVPAAGSTMEPPSISQRSPVLARPESAAVSPLLRPLPKPAGSEITAESNASITRVPAASEIPPASSIQPGPKKETARISILPQSAPAAKPSDMTEAPSPLNISRPHDPFDALPRSFCWGLFGIAALIFLIQIWNYVVS